MHFRRSTSSAHQSAPCCPSIPIRIAARTLRATRTPVNSSPTTKIGVGQDAIEPPMPNPPAPWCSRRPATADESGVDQPEVSGPA
jgi:hypothetical protein